MEIDYPAGSGLNLVLERCQRSNTQPSSGQRSIFYRAPARCHAELDDARGGERKRHQSAHHEREQQGHGERQSAAKDEEADLHLDLVLEYEDEHGGEDKEPDHQGHQRRAEPVHLRSPAGVGRGERDMAALSRRSGAGGNRNPLAPSGPPAPRGAREGFVYLHASGEAIADRSSMEQGKV